VKSGPFKSCAAGPIRPTRPQVARLRGLGRYRLPAATHWAESKLAGGAEIQASQGWAIVHTSIPILDSAQWSRPLRLACDEQQGCVAGLLEIRSPRCAAARSRATRPHIINSGPPRRVWWMTCSCCTSHLRPRGRHELRCRPHRRFFGPSGAPVRGSVLRALCSPADSAPTFSSNHRASVRFHSSGLAPANLC